jgi:hypothetical protein
MIQVAALTGWDDTSISAASVLSSEESERFQACGYLVVYSPSHSQRAYRIWRCGRVILYQGATALAELHLEVDESVPPDNLPLIHKLWIEANEQQYLETVQHFPAKESRRGFSLAGCSSYS